MKSPLWSTGVNLDLRRRNGSVRTGDLFAKLMGEHGRLSCTQCLTRGSVRFGTRIRRPPPIFALEVPAEDSRFPQVIVDESVQMVRDEGHDVWRVLAVIYLGDVHFTCRVLSANREVWYYDGKRNDGRCILEAHDIDLSAAYGARACAIIYGKRD